MVPSLSWADEEAQVGVDFQFSPLFEVPHIAVWFLASLHGAGISDCLVQAWNWGTICRR